MDIHLTLIGVYVVLGLLTRLRRRPKPILGGLTLEVRDLITLRMVLCDTQPEQRGDLLAAHRDWRTESARRPTESASRRVRPRRACECR